MAIVVFDPSQFKTAFPEFAAVPDARLTLLFNMATASLIDNTDASIVVDVVQRASMLDLAVAHLLTLFGTTVAGTGNAGPSGVVGRLSSATEGSVSSSFEMNVPVSPGSAWWNQTQYGAMFWVMMAPFRSFRYSVVGRSGVGHSIDFLNHGRIVQLRGAAGGTNSGTPNGG